MALRHVEPTTTSPSSSRVQREIHQGTTAAAEPLIRAKLISERVG
jgi:hypothetical protein